MKHAYPLLLVEDHDGARRSFMRLLSTAANVVAAPSCRAARGAWLDHDGLAGAIIDVHLPDGSGLDLVEPLRTAYPRLRILVMTADEDVRHIERAQLLGVEFVRKPPPRENVFTFVERCVPKRSPLVHFARRHGLSERETELVQHLLEGKVIKELPSIMEIGAATIRTYRSRILRKTCFPTMADVVRAILTDSRRP